VATAGTGLRAIRRRSPARFRTSRRSRATSTNTRSTGPRRPSRSVLATSCSSTSTSIRPTSRTRSC
jgi:hypothetical protein